jgi:hypothetical protein
VRIGGEVFHGPPLSPCIPRATGTVGAVYEPDPVITCIDCGGRAHLNGHPPEEGWQPGMLTMYRCEDCLDGWYLEVPDLDDH